MHECGSEGWSTLRSAFELVEARRKEEPDVEIGVHIAEVANRFGLSSAQRAWMQWTLDPSSVAVQSKEPVRER